MHATPAERQKPSLPYMQPLFGEPLNLRASNIVPGAPTLLDHIHALLSLQQAAAAIHWICPSLQVGQWGTAHGRMSTLAIMAGNQ